MARMLIINIDVPDIELGTTFYEAGLCFKLRRLLFEKSVAEMDSAAGRLYLIEQPIGSVAVPNTQAIRDYTSHWTPVHFDVPVDNLDAAVERAIAAGATASGSSARHVFGRIAPMRDPFGHGFCLIEFSEVGYDAVVSE